MVGSDHFLIRDRDAKLSAPVDEVFRRGCFGPYTATTRPEGRTEPLG